MKLLKELTEQERQMLEYNMWAEDKRKKMGDDVLRQLVIEIGDHWGQWTEYGQLVGLYEDNDDYYYIFKSGDEFKYVSCVGVLKYSTVPI